MPVATPDMAMRAQFLDDTERVSVTTTASTPTLLVKDATYYLFCEADFRFKQGGSDVDSGFTATKGNPVTARTLFGKLLATTDALYVSFIVGTGSTTVEILRVR